MKLELSLALLFFLSFAEILSGEVFSLVVLLCDNYIALKPLPASSSSSSTIPNASLKEDGEAGARRFLLIAMVLPIEIQMVLCNRLFSLDKDVVASRHSEPSFRKLLKPFLWRTQDWTKGERKKKTPEDDGLFGNDDLMSSKKTTSTTKARSGSVKKEKKPAAAFSDPLLDDDDIFS